MYTHMLKKNIVQKNKQRGFTLVEALVSLAIFSVVMVTAVGIILAVITSNKRNQAINSVVNNLNYSIESMVRDVKTGFSYKCNYSPISPQTVSDFKSEPANCDGTPIGNIALISTISGTGEKIVKYEYKLPVGGQTGYIEKTIYTEIGGIVSTAVYPLTDRINIDIRAMSFTTDPGSALYDSTGTILNPSPLQPSVALLIKGTAKVNAINISDFFIQTLISQRLPNLI